MSDPDYEATRQRLLKEAIADALAIQHRFRPEPLLKLTGKGHYNSHFIEEMIETKKQRKSKT